MTGRPKWTNAIRAFISDDVIDDKYGYPMDGSDDDLRDQIEAAVNAILCERYGHEIIDDQCGIPSHRFCVYCNGGVIPIRHQLHYRTCNCLGESDKCCVADCECRTSSPARCQYHQGFDDGLDAAFRWVREADGE